VPLSIQIGCLTLAFLAFYSIYVRLMRGRSNSDPTYLSVARRMIVILVPVTIICFLIGFVELAAH